jgi:hypothetical protein
MAQLPRQKFESGATAATETCRERGPPFSQGNQGRLSGDQVYAKHTRQATGAAHFPRLVPKVLPHDALGQVIGHDGQPTTCRGG